jgi:hypothetical protein
MTGFGHCDDGVQPIEQDRRLRTHSHARKLVINYMPERAGEARRISFSSRSADHASEARWLGWLCARTTSISENLEEGHPSNAGGFFERAEADVDLTWLSPCAGLWLPTPHSES